MPGRRSISLWREAGKNVADNPGARPPGLPGPSGALECGDLRRGRPLLKLSVCIHPDILPYTCVAGLVYVSSSQGSPPGEAYPPLSPEESRSSSEGTPGLKGLLHEAGAGSAVGSPERRRDPERAGSEAPALPDRADHSLQSLLPQGFRTASG